MTIEPMVKAKKMVRRSAVLLAPKFTLVNLDFFEDAKGDLRFLESIHSLTKTATEKKKPMKLGADEIASSVYVQKKLMQESWNSGWSSAKLAATADHNVARLAAGEPGSQERHQPRTREEVTVNANFSGLSALCEANWRDTQNRRTAQQARWCGVSVKFRGGGEGCLASTPLLGRSGSIGSGIRVGA